MYMIHNPDLNPNHEGGGSILTAGKALCHLSKLIFFGLLCFPAGLSAKKIFFGFDKKSP